MGQLCMWDYTLSVLVSNEVWSNKWHFLSRLKVWVSNPWAISFDSVILYATANRCKTWICVNSSQSSHRDLTVRPDGDVISTNPLVLGHVREAHYISLQPKQGEAFCNTLLSYSAAPVAWRAPKQSPILVQKSFDHIVGLRLELIKVLWPLIKC